MRQLDEVIRRESKTQLSGVRVKSKRGGTGEEVGGYYERLSQKGEVTPTQTGVFFLSEDVVTDFICSKKMCRFLTTEKQRPTAHSFKCSANNEIV